MKDLEIQKYIFIYENNNFMNYLTNASLGDRLGDYCFSNLSPQRYNFLIFQSHAHVHFYILLSVT